MDKIIGFIYIVRCGESSYYKIGQSKANVVRRVGSLQIGCPYLLELIFCAKIPNYLSIERQLHLDYELCNLQGEWFDLSDTDVDNIQHSLFETKVPLTQSEEESLKEYLDFKSYKLSKLEQLRAVGLC